MSVGGDEIKFASHCGGLCEDETMKARTREMIEGAEALTRFSDALKAVPKSLKYATPQSPFRQQTPGT